MRAWSRRILGHLGRALPFTLLTGAALLARNLWPPRDLDATGVSAWRDLVLTLAFWLVTLAITVGVGRRLLRRIAPPGLSRLEDLLFAFALGLGAIGYAFLGLSLVGLLARGPIAALLLTASLWVGDDLRAWLLGVRSLIAAAPRGWQEAGWLARSVSLVGAAIALLALVNALSPPSDYDGLMYHLVGPRLFLVAGRLIPYPDNWYVNAPFTLEMVFTVGMAFGDDVFPKLIHYATGMLLVAATFAAGRRWVGKRGGWLAAAAILAVPTLPIWASFAYIDVGWSLFEFLALVAALVWWRDRSSPRWLALGGVMIGLAMGSKYLGLMGFAVLGVFVTLVTLRSGWRNLLGSCLALALPALIVASPWYVKNWLWFGNPVYPLYFGAAGWDPARLELYNAYLSSFGAGRTWLDSLLLPWNLYAQHARFSAVMNRIDVPSLLFPVLLLYPFLKKERTVTALLWVGLARGVLWAVGSQQTRFLLPIFPALSVATAYVMDRWQPRHGTKIPWKQLFPMLAVGMSTITLFYQVAYLVQYRPVAVVLGAESRRAFLARSYRVFQAARYVLEALPASSRTLLLCDGRVYYCMPACIPNPDHFLWAAEVAERTSDVALVEWLASIGATHVLVPGEEELDFLLQHDPEGAMQASLERLSSLRRAGCLTEVFNDGWASVLAITCR